LAREGESVAAARVLGLGEEDVIFLGYPDTLLNNIYRAGSGTQVFTGPSGGTTTYGTRGLGRADYHTFLTGAPGNYNRDTMRQDFEALIRNYRPDEIYTVTRYDSHPDHHAVAMFVQDALDELRQSGAIGPTQLFQGIVWVPGATDWPMVGSSGFTPTIPFQEPPTLSSETPLHWSDTYRFAVPPEMLSTDPATSMKYRAILRYQSQVFDWLTSFARADEFFWLTSY
jgi:LmbE family N-acetylglucosaminyl deacetylase